MLIGLNLTVYCYVLIICAMKSGSKAKEIILHWASFKENVAFLLHKTCCFVHGSQKVLGIKFNFLLGCHMAFVLKGCSSTTWQHQQESNTASPLSAQKVYSWTACVFEILVCQSGFPSTTLKESDYFKIEFSVDMTGLLLRSLLSGIQLA